MQLCIIYIYKITFNAASVQVLYISSLIVSVTYVQYIISINLYYAFINIYLINNILRRPKEPPAMEASLFFLHATVFPVQKKNTEKRGASSVPGLALVH